MHLALSHPLSPTSASTRSLPRCSPQSRH
jgi:hypothetical protein